MAFLAQNKTLCPKATVHDVAVGILARRQSHRHPGPVLFSTKLNGDWLPHATSQANASPSRCQDNRLASAQEGPAASGLGWVSDCMWSVAAQLINGCRKGALFAILQYMYAVASSRVGTHTACLYAYEAQLLGSRSRWILKCCVNSVQLSAGTTSHLLTHDQVICCGAGW